MIEFHKYHGTGNDFIIIDNRDLTFNSDTKTISMMCHRRFGIGADGLMLLENSDKHDFLMRYYNSDGKEGSMCGNGGRSIVKFAKDIGLIKDSTIFLATDGVHHATINDNIISLKMADVNCINKNNSHLFLDTGSPHHVEFVNNIKEFDVFNKGQNIRNSETYFPNGTNVNFVEVIGNSLFVRTFERGVEDETYSCGTGVVASVLAYAFLNNIDSKSINVDTKGGQLSVKFESDINGYSNIWLTGPATKVFKGIIQLK